MAALKTAEEVTGHLTKQMNACLGINLLYLGQKLEIFKAMNALGPTNATILAKSTGLSERYLEEFLRAVTLHEYVKYSPGPAITEASSWDSGIVRDEGTFSLSAPMAEVLLDQSSEHFYGNSLMMPVILGKPSDKLIGAFRSDEGVAFADYGDDCSKFVEDSHSKMYQNELVSNWMQLEGLRDLKNLMLEGGVVVDLGCGSGASSVSLAKGFPKVLVHAIDCDQVSIEKANERIKTAESKKEIIPGQVIPHCCFGHEAPLSPNSVDLVLLFICLHDMSNPSEVLASAKTLLKPSGSVLVLEFTLPDTFSEALPGSELAARCKELYSASVLHCLPVAKVGAKSQAIGTCFSLPTMKAVAAKGGFSKVANYELKGGMTMFRLQE